jgi:hypothetical protein
MNVEVAFSGSVDGIEALARFLKCLASLVPEPLGQPKVVMGDDGVIYVKAGFATEEAAWQAGERMSAVSAEIVEDADVLVVLAPYAG